MDRRAHYVNVALELFVDHGFNGVSIDQIVATAGGSKATLYRYFDSKEALFAAIIDDIATSSAPIAIDDELESADLETGLRLIATTTATGALHPRTIELLQLAITESRRFPDLAATLFARGPAVNYQRLRTFLIRHADAGTIDVSDPQIAAEQFLGGIVGHQQLRLALGLARPRPADISQRIDAAVTAFIASHRRPRRSGR